MIPRRFLVAASVMVCSCSIEESSPPYERIRGDITVMPESALPGAFYLFENDGRTYWKPSMPEVTKAADLIHAALERGRKNPLLVSIHAHNPRDDWVSEYYVRKIEEVLNHYSSYSCQVIGLQDGRKKFIAFSFYSTNYGHPWKNLDSEFVSVCDGGSGFWRIEYDVSEKRFVSFTPNGDG